MISYIEELPSNHLIESKIPKPKIATATTDNDNNSSISSDVFYDEQTNVQSGHSISPDDDESTPVPLPLFYRYEK